MLSGVYAGIIFGTSKICKSSNFCSELFRAFARHSLREALTSEADWYAPMDWGGCGGFPVACQKTVLPKKTPKDGRFHGAKGLVYQRSFQANWLSGMEDMGQVGMWRVRMSLDL